MKIEGNKRKMAVIILLIAVLLILTAVLAFILPAQRAREKKIQELTRLGNEIEEALRNHDFETAEEKINQYNMPDAFTREEERTWGEKKNVYQLELTEAKDAYYRENGQIHAPASSLYFEGKDALQAVQMFTGTGFVNVECCPSAEEEENEASNIIEKISIDGIEEFEASEFFDMNSKVIIYCK